MNRLQSPKWLTEKRQLLGGWRRGQVYELYEFRSASLPVLFAGPSRFRLGLPDRIDRLSGGDGRHETPLLAFVCETE